MPRARLTKRLLGAEKAIAAQSRSVEGLAISPIYLQLLQDWPVELIRSINETDDVVGAARGHVKACSAEVIQQVKLACRQVLERIEIGELKTFEAFARALPIEALCGLDYMYRIE